MIQTGYLSACKSAARYVFLTLLSLAFLQSLHAQNPLAPSAMQQKAREEIQRRGLDEAVVRGRLLDRGINIDSITPEQLPYLQDSIQQVIDELEAEKSKPAKTPAVKQKVSPPGNAGNAPGKRTGELQQKPPSAARKEEALAGEQQFYDSLAPAQVWGQHLFRDKSLAVFRTSDETTAPDHYILSTGDVLTISVFGPSQFDAQFEISREGYIQPEELPKIFLKGLRLAQAKELLRSRFSQFYRFAPEQFAVTLTSPRNITVNIFGETFHYGSFSLSALNTAFNALVAAGGPNDLGTVRNIKVIRGKETKRLDVYAFMNNPAIQYDFFLENNDIIHVPVAERIVGIRGAIRRPFRYELTGNENLVGLLEFAGGLNADAYRELIQVRRYTDDKQVLIDVNLKELLSKKQDFPLLNGDEVLVRVIPNPIENTVIIEGSVEYPGQYAFDDTKKVSDLVKKGALRPEARTDIAFLLRTNNDKTTRLIQLDVGRLLATPGAGQDLPLQPGDRLTIYAQGRYTDISTISITGAVREGMEKYPYTHDSSLTLQRAILLAGGLRPDANGLGLITRSEPGSIKELKYVEVDLAAAFDNPNSAANIVLRPFDRLEAFSRSSFSDTATIRVSGAVRRPGEFVYGSAMSLRDALLLAGGLKLEAARNRVDIFRIQIRENEPTRAIVAAAQVDSNLVTPGGFTILPYDEIVVRTVPEFEFQHFVEIKGEVRYPGRYALINDNETLSDLIQRAGGLTSEAFTDGASLYRTKEQKGYVVTDLSEALRNYRSTHNHLLKGGDVVTVPKREDLVTIRTSNTRASDVIVAPLIANGLINVAYSPGKRAGWFIKKYAAGFGKNAKRTLVTVEQPNGKINRTINFGLFKIYPRVSKGSVINVGSKAVKERKLEKEGKPIDWDKAFTQILATVGTLATVLLAVSAIKN